MLCRAKINLTLHVGAPIAGGRWSGYHPVDSLVVFADVGDEIGFAAADRTSLHIDGPFGAGLTSGPDNLILKALEACSASPQAVRLTKNLPVSSGMGGGSANAAAILRAFDLDNAVDPVSLGADVPVCRLSRTALMSGIGETVESLPGLRQVPAVLVNPGLAVSTAEIFRRYDDANPDTLPHGNASTGSLLDRALDGTNDLQPVATALVPEIGKVLSDISAMPECNLARMTGSGATCFGLFESDAAAEVAAEKLSAKGWWAVATRLGDSGP